jgi:hypothetical protein
MAGFLTNAKAAAGHAGSYEPEDMNQNWKTTEAEGRSGRPNWSGPAGGQQWTYDPTTGQPTMSVTSPYQSSFDALKDPMQKAASYDPTQARDAAIKQNQEYGMSLLNPQLQQQNSQFNAQSANTGLEPGTEAYNNANQALGQKQASAIAGVENQAISQGNETQRTQQLQQMVPYQQLGSLTSATYSSPYMGKATDYTGAYDTYMKQKKSNMNADQKNMQNVTNSWSSIPSNKGGKGGKGGS